MAGAIGNLIISVATAADTIVAWGSEPRLRDQQLRQFWPTEPFFASALFTTIAQYVAFGWSLAGPPRTVRLSQEVLNNVQGGQGWEALMTPWLIDYFTQDNGAFMEIVRLDNNDPGSPVITLNHLDAFRCLRTGIAETPVIYIDLFGNHHLLKWFQVLAMTEMPAPQEEARGIQYCALTRLLRTAQIERDQAIVQQEKAAGRFTRQIHIVSGVSTRLIEDAVAQKQSAADAAGQIRFIQPLVMGSTDPTARISKETIDLASIPDNWDPNKALDRYVLAMSLAFGIDFQSLAPLPGGGLGSASQSKVLNMKSRGKGPGLFMQKIKRTFNMHGILPRTVTFEFGEQDIAEQMEKTALRKERALEREIRIRSGEITTEVARQMALDDGDLDERYIRMMRETNATDEVIVPSTETVADYEGGPVTPGMPGPKEAPGSAAKPPADENSNNKRPNSPATSQKRNSGGPGGTE